MTNAAESPKPAPATNNETPQAPASATASPRHCAPKLNTKDRLFGATPASPKIVKNTATFKSNIFGNEPPSSPAKASKKPIAVIERNPVTGEVKIPPRVTV
uniref:PEST proteolytic signal-containing nuclear protein n=1 Tax=Panagrellus redivivus TaxID=6233 RepID=A0A7E4V8R6_PANRE